MSRPVVVLQILPDLSTGGGQQVVSRLIAASDRQRVVHHVASFGGSNEMRGVFEEAGAVMHDLGPWSVARSFGLIRALRRLAASEGVQVIHTHGTPVDKLNGQWVAYLEGLPVVRTLHGIRPRLVRPRLRRRALARWLRQISTMLLGGALDRFAMDAVVAVSEAVADDWRAYWEKRGHEPRVIYNGIPVAEFALRSGEEARARLDAMLGISGRRPVLISVSRLHPGKRNGLVLDAFALVRRRLPDAQLLLVGDGSERGDLEQRAARSDLSGHVHFLGTRKDVPELLETSDLMLFASEAEGFGLVVLEALASGTPVVSTSLPSLRRLSEDCEALCFVDRDAPEALADVATALLEQPERRAALGADAQAAVRAHWDVSLSAQRYVDLYEGLLSPGALRRNSS